VVGNVVPVGAQPYEIVGVAPPGFTGVEALGSPPLLWAPAMQRPVSPGDDPVFARWGSSWINVVGRLAEGVSPEEARASMDVVSARLRAANPVNEGMEVLLAEGMGLDPQSRTQARQLSLILFVIVGVVLLLACTNVANLFLARATGRRREVGVRLAMGARRTRLARQLVTESILLALVATVLSVPFVLAAERLIPHVFPYTILVSVAPDLRVFLFLVLVGVSAGLLFGLAPAWSASARGVTEALREGASTLSRGKTRLRDGLVVVQLALSLGLLAGPDPTGTDLYVRLLEAARRTPGVQTATLASAMPLEGPQSRRTTHPVQRQEVNVEAEMIVVGPDYFETLGVPLLRGRSLGSVEDEPERVVVVNEALAHLFWPNENPIGKELVGEPAWRVVGLAGDVQMRSLRSAANPAVYYPMSQEFEEFMSLHLRAESGGRLSASTFREVVASVDPELPVWAVVDLEGALGESMGETRAVGLLVGVFALLALVLAAVGLYGLVSYGPSQRVREMGIRIALGAEPGSLARLILARGVGIAVVGVLLGFGVSLGLGQTLRGLLYGVAPTDLPTLGVAALFLLGTAGLASWIPARRAGRVDAAVSLREE
jgi:hypothetical protein